MNTSRPRGRAILLTCVYSYCALLVLVLLLVRGVSTYSWATVPKLVDQTAHRPFVTRALLPSIVRGLVAATPGVRARLEARFSRALGEAHAGSRPDRILAMLGWTVGDVYVHVVASGVMLACFFALAWVLRRLVQVFYDAPPAVADLAPVFGLLALPPFFIPYARYLYDPGTLFLWALATLWVVERRRVALWLLLPVLAYHKETAVLLPFVIALREPKEVPLVRKLTVIALQLAVVVAVRLALAQVYRDNPGETVLLVGPSHSVQLLIDLFRRLPVAPLVVAALWLLIQSGWREKSAFARRAFLVVLLPLVLLGFAFGYVDEIRGYYETWALVVLLSLPTLVRLLGAGTLQERRAIA